VHQSSAPNAVTPMPVRGLDGERGSNLQKFLFLFFKKESASFWKKKQKLLII
jgi:hypothetical protein